MIVASCAKDAATTGPRIAILLAVSGSGQSGPLGSTLSQPFVVQVKDQDGVPVDGESVSWTVTNGGGSVSPSKSATDLNGFATTSLRLGNVTGTNAVTATFGQSSPVIFVATATAAPPAKVQIASGDAQSGVVATQLNNSLTVKVTDAVDGPKLGVLVTFAVLSGGGNLNAGSATTDAAGTASVRWTLGTSAGAQSVLASVAGLTPVTFTGTGMAGAADALTILTGNNQTGSPGSPLLDSLRVRLTDRFSNPISGVTISWAPIAGGGTVNPATSNTDANGRAATRWTLGSTGGPKSVIASGGGFVQTFTGGGNVTYLALTAGGRHSCGLAQGGVAYCWGYNGDGQLGIGSAPLGSGPVFASPQPTGTTGNLTFAVVVDGRFHTCALTLAGVGYCWGNNLEGRVGSGGLGSVLSPAVLTGTNTYAQVAPGGLHSCGLDLSGRPFCWGANGDGQVGDGSLTNQIAATAVAGGMIFSAITSGGAHSCALAGGAGWCWGGNAGGQLGDGTNASALVPVAVGGGLTLSVISAGYGHTCGIANAGAAYCWGGNASGQLGDGSVLNRNLPTLVIGAQVFSALSTGLAHTCGIAAGGALYCWGSNAKGQLGDGTAASRSAPTLVLGGLAFRSVSAGDGHTCGVSTSNVAYCWGDNEYGQLGDGTTVARLTPTRIAFQP
jgi:alpha-tubulin suppressor-like RCC1 family protein